VIPQLKRAARFLTVSRKKPTTFKDEPLSFDIQNVNFELDGSANLDPAVTAPSKGAKSAQVVQTQIPGCTTDIGTVEDLLFISEALVNLPCVIWGKLPPRDPEKIGAFNKAFHRYCTRKGIDPWSMFFDEFEMVMMSITILAGYRTDYVELYKKPSDKKDTNVLNLDYNHAKELEEDKVT